MSLRIHHALDSSSTEVGSVTPLVRGLISELRSRGFTCTVNHAQEDCHEDAIAATRAADLVHVHGCAYPAMIGAARLAKRFRKPLVLSPAGELAASAIRRHARRTRWYGKLYEKGLVRRAAAVLAQNLAEAEALGQRYLRDVMTLPFGLTPDDDGVPTGEGLPRLVNIPDGRCILMLAAIEPQSGCAALLKAFAEIGPDANGWYVVIAGRDRGDYRKMLEAAIRRKGGDERVVITTAADPAAQRAWLSRADILVAPSLEPGPAPSILRAAVACVPVLASGQVLPDALMESAVVCRADRGGIREGLRRILQMSDPQRAELATSAKCVVGGELAWRILADRYVTLYNSLA